MFWMRENAEAVMDIHKQATALKKTDINLAIDMLRNANAIIDDSGGGWSIEPLLRLPMFLQLAGRFNEAVIEFDLLLKNAEKDAELYTPENNRSESVVNGAIQFRLWAIYDKMRVAYKKQGLLEQSKKYGEIAEECSQKMMLYI